MPGRLLVLVFATSSLCSFSQNKIETYFDYNWRETFSDHASFYSISQKTDSGWYREIFYIGTKKLQMAGLYADDKNKDRNGVFYWVYPNNSFKTVGKYIHNKKEGAWLDYYSNGVIEDSLNYHDDHPAGVSLSWYRSGYMKDSLNVDGNGNGIYISWFDNGSPSSAGRYVDFTKKHGKWQFFHKNGKISAIEVYDHDSLQSKQFFDESGNEVVAEEKDHEAQFPGGEKAWSNYLSNHLHFPSNFEFQNSERVVVVVSALIDENGKVIDAEVSVPVHPKFDEIALNAIKSCPSFIPAVEHNRKVYYSFRVPISFSQGFRSE